MKKVIVLLFTFAFLFLTSVRSANGYMYGEGQLSSQLIVDKRVRAINTEWQDNLPASQVTFKEGEVVEFEIKVKNSGDKELKNIKVTDYLPSFFEFVFGPANSDDKREINWEIEDLSEGEEQSFQIRGRVNDTKQSVVEGTICLINKAKAVAETGEADEDTASYCLAGAKKLPTAGAGNLGLGVIIAGLIGAVGIALRKFGRGEILA